MILVKLFLSLSCVSAAFVSTVSRSLAAEFSRKMNNQNVEELPNFRMPVNLTKMPKMPSFPNILPIAHCDSLPENSGSNSFSNSAVRSVSNTLEGLEGNQVLNWRDYESMLSSQNYAAISDAFKRGAIDFSYIPRTKEFCEVLSNRKCVEGNAIMKQYFDSGLFDEMVAIGLITYEDMVDSALQLRNYFVANMALDRIIEKHRPEILSPDYKSKTGSFNNRQIIYTQPYHDSKFSPHSDIEKAYDCKMYMYYYKNMEEFKFFKKYYLIFEESSDDPWMRKLRKRYVNIEFNGCDL